MAFRKTIFTISIALVRMLWLETGPGRLGGANAQGIIRSDSVTETYRQGFEDGQREALERGDRIAKRIS